MPRRSRNEDSPRSARAVRLPGTSREVITRGVHPSGAEGVPVTSRSRIDASSASDAEVKAAYRELKSSYKGTATSAGCSASTGGTWARP